MLFLSHCGADSAAANELARSLRTAGVKVWLDLDELQPGDAWMAALEEALQQASAFAVYVGASGIQHWVDREVRYALERNTADPAFRIIPILGEGAADPRTLPFFLRQHQAIDLRDNTSPAELKRLVGAVLARPAEAVSLLPVGTAPFRGLEYFDVEHAHLFFGRDAETDELLEKLRADRFLAVVAASGSGKSSLVRAGLIPALHRGRLRSGGASPASWRIAICRPGDRPLRALARALPDLAPEMAPAERIRTIEECARQLELGPDGLDACVSALVPRGQRALLIVDQFEEVFTLTSSPAERRQFIDSLLAVTDGRREPSVHVVITLRADFYSRCWEHPELPRRIAGNQHAARPLLRAQVMEVMQKPLALAGASFEAGLVDRILDDVGVEPGSLPLVEHALLQLWERRRGSVLTHAAYEEIGGVTGALAHHADAVFERLDESGRDVAQKIFLRLTQPGEGTEDTRRRAGRDEIVALGSDEAVAERVLSTLADADARLVITRREGETNVVEVAHEALIRAWPRLRAWIEANRAAIRVERRLIDATREWIRLNGDPDSLLRGTHLSDTQEWARQHLDDLRPEEQAFLAAGIEARDRAFEEAEARRQRELQLAKRLMEEAQARATAEQARSQAERRETDGARTAARRYQRLARSLALISVAAVTAAAGALLMWRRSDAQFAQAESRELGAAARSALTADPTAALDLAVRAVKRARTAEAESALRRALSGATMLAELLHPGPGTPSFSRDGRAIVMTRADGSSSEWDFATGQGPRAPGQSVAASGAAAFACDAPLVTAAVRDGNVQLTDAATGQEIRVLHPERGASGALSSCDGRRVLTFGADATARVWDVRTGLEQTVLPGHEAGVGFAAFSSNGRRVVTAGREGTIRVWDVPLAEQLLLETAARDDAHAGGVNAVAFSPDGRHIVTAGNDQVARLWDATTGREQAVLKGHARAVISAAYDRSGGRILTAAVDGTARIWDGDSGKPRLDLVHNDPNLMFTPEQEGWMLQDELLRRGPQAGSLPFTASFSSDGRYVITAGWDRTARVWDLATGRVKHSLDGHEGLVFAAAFSPDDKRVVTASGDGTARLWNAETGAAQRDLPGHSGQVFEAVFSPDGRHIATVSSDGIVRRWIARTLEEMSQLQVATVSFSPDGRQLLTTNVDGTVHLRDVASTRPRRVLSGHKGLVKAAAFRPDGHRLITAGEDGTVRLWDVDSGIEYVVFRQHTGAVRSAAFSPDGLRIVTGGQDGTVRVFLIDLDALLEQAEARLPNTPVPTGRERTATPAKSR